MLTASNPKSTLGLLIKEVPTLKLIVIIKKTELQLFSVLAFFYLNYIASYT